MRDAGPRVLVAGSVNIDHVLTVDRLPRRGETVAALEHSRGGGGKGANQAAACADAGVSTWLVACVGDDVAGAEAVADLAERGIRVDAVVRTSAQPTGLAAVVTSRAERDNQIVVAGGANGHLGAADVDAAVRRARPAVVLVNFEIPDEAVETAIAAARRCGALPIVNPAPFRPLWPALRGGILTPNESEASQLLAIPRTELGDPDSLATAFRDRLGDAWDAAVVTRGAAGAAVVSGTGATFIAAPAVDVVDTTGAGDVFNGTLAAALSRGSRLSEAARLAVGAASASTLHHGARAR